MDAASYVSQGFLRYSIHSTFYHSLLIQPYRSVLESDGTNVSVAEPVLQCVQIKPLGGAQGAPERYRVVFSDMQNFVQTMLATRKVSGQETRLR